MFTRKQFLNKECTHRQYYAQFVTIQHIATVADYNLDGENKTPLRTWDNTFFYGTAIPMKSVGDYMTLSGKVCILKEACRQSKEK